MLINTSVTAAAIRGMAPQLARFPGSRAVLLHADGSPYREGEILKQPDLARTYREVAEHGIGWFYRGPLAAEIGKWMAASGGILSADDFACYRVRRRNPLLTTYRDLTIVGFPPVSSGGVHVAQILNILEHFDLKKLYQADRARFYHVLAEAMKLAFADRAYWLGDPDFCGVPQGLADKQYAARLARRIDVDHDLVALPRRPGIELVMQRRLREQPKRVGLLLPDARRVRRRGLSRHVGRRPSPRGRYPAHRRLV